MSTANENDNFRFSRNFYEHYFCFQADEQKCRDEELSEAFPPILSEFDLGLDEILIAKVQSFLISICEATWSERRGKIFKCISSRRIL